MGTGEVVVPSRGDRRADVGRRGGKWGLKGMDEGS